MEILKPYLALATQARNDNDVLSLVDRALSDPSLYLYAQLFFTLQTNSLRNPGTFSELTTIWLRVLRSFAWGTWREYHDNTSKLPQLNSQHNTKLRLLTLMSTFAASPHSSYDNLLHQLGLSDASELEVLISHAMDQKLLIGNLKGEDRKVNAQVARHILDPRPAEIYRLKTLYDRWEMNCESTIKRLELQVAEVRRQCMLRNTRHQAFRTSEVINSRRFVSEKDDQLSSANTIGNHNEAATEGGWEGRERPKVQSTIGIRRAPKRGRDGADGE